MVGTKRRHAILFSSLLLIVTLFAAIAATPSGAARDDSRVITQDVIDSTIAALIKDKGENEAPRIRKGVSQAASRWLEEDGTPEIFNQFCRDQFMSLKDANLYLKRADKNFEQINGLFQEMYIHVNEPLQVETGAIMPADYLFSTVAPWSHITDDFFQSKVAFAILLNYPLLYAEREDDSGHRLDAGRMGEGEARRDVQLPYIRTGLSAGIAGHIPMRTGTSAIIL